MKKYLKILFIFAFCFCNTQVYGQSAEGDWGDFDWWDWLDFVEDEDKDKEENGYSDGTLCPGCNPTPRDSTLKIMTYNLGPGLQGLSRYDKHISVINACNADIISLQEVRLWFPRIVRKTGLNGHLSPAILGNFEDGELVFTWLVLPGGNGLLWKSWLGNPLSIKTEYLGFSGDGSNSRNYCIIEFKELFVIFTHYPSVGESNRVAMSYKIMNEDCVKNYRKPVYIVGDMNARKGKNSITYLEDAGFKVLNDDEGCLECNKDGTIRVREKMTGIDLILEYNKNPNLETLDEGVPNYPDDSWKCVVSDHLPYFVKRKYK